MCIIYYLNHIIKILFRKRIITFGYFHYSIVLVSVILLLSLYPNTIVLYNIVRHNLQTFRRKQLNQVTDMTTRRANNNVRTAGLRYSQ